MSDSNNLSRLDLEQDTNYQKSYLKFRKEYLENQKKAEEKQKEKMLIDRVKYKKYVNEKVEPDQ